MHRAGVPLAIMLAVVTGCSGPKVEASGDISFLVAAGDSTFFVDGNRSAMTVQRSPLLLANLDGRFHELYIVDRDFSFQDALLVGQAVYRRDLATGDSTLVWEDTRIREVAQTWQRRHPDARPPGPDEEGEEDPEAQATSETELLDVVGPYVSYEYHLDVDVQGEAHEHVTRRGVLDIRDGTPMTLEALTDTATARVAIESGRRSFEAAIDSVRRTTDARAARAREVLGAFRFDPTSFELIEVDRGLVASFHAPGSGGRAGGYALPHGDAPLGRPYWLDLIGDSRPAAFDSTQLEWKGNAYGILATVRADGATATLELVRRRTRRPLTEVPTPVRRIFRLGADREQQDAIRRAFAEWSALPATPTAGTRRANRRLLPLT